VSDSDSPKDDQPSSNKSARPLTVSQQWKNLMDGLLNDEGISEEHKLTKRERAELEDMREVGNAFLRVQDWESKAAEMREAEAALDQWSQGKELSPRQSQMLVKAFDLLVDAGDKYLTASERERTFRLRTKIVREADEMQWRRRTAKGNEPSGHKKNERSDRAKER
jgi:hypothetical protein